jgi:hypothetical protein
MPTIAICHQWEAPISREPRQSVSQSPVDTRGHGDDERTDGQVPRLRSWAISLKQACVPCNVEDCPGCLRRHIHPITHIVSLES